MRGARRVLYALLLLVSVGFAADQQVLTVAPGLSEIRVIGGADTGAAFFATMPPTLIHRSYTLADGDTVCVFNSVKGETYVIVSVEALAKGETRLVTWVVSTEGVTPDPVVPDPVVPVPPQPIRPLGFAGDVYDIARQINRPDEAAAIANAFRTVHSEIAARSDMPPREAMAKLNALMTAIAPSPPWKQFQVALERYQASRPQSRQLTLGTFADVVRGLEAAK